MTFISPINTITLDCSGNVLPNAILLADVDANKNNELLVGTQDGELFIYKVFRGENHAQLWRRAQGLGYITAVTVGPLTTNSNEPRPIICVANAEGAIHLFFLRANLQRNRVRSAGGTINNSNRNDSKLQLHGSINVSNDDDQQQQMQVAFSQQLIANSKCLLIQDYNENEKQLIISYRNRIIRIFNSMLTEEFDGRLAGRFVLKHVYNIAEQIYTLNSRRLSTKEYELIVSQPGGNLLRFNPNEENNLVLATDMCSNGATGYTEAIALERFEDDVVYATITADRIDIFHNQLNRILKTVSLGTKSGYLCGLQKGPMTKDNYNQLVTISSVDGDTFILDRHANMTRFRPPLSSNMGCSGGSSDSISTTSFFDQIQAFTSGLFGDNNMFCFIYILTHSDKIIIVHSIDITNTKTTNLLTVLDNKYKEISSTSEKFRDILHPSH